MLCFILEDIIVGVNFLFHNIYRLIVGKEFYLNMWSSIIIFCLVVITSFANVLKEGPRKIIND
ncbi:hypothetical protein [Bacillus bingmayongensis]|uniref:hypothetical protein n=1 Tax=Bacillus bingmayongensis TaxID=1150157 RepID=UPI0035AB8F60